jgi:RES domain-containing protein
VKLFRLAKEKAGRYRADDLSGQGAALAGGRWNPRGVAVLYTCCHASTAVLEARVHAAGLLPKANFYLVTLEVPDAVFEAAHQPDLPEDWNDLARDPASTVAIGRAWIEAAHTLAMRVPSVVCPADANLLLNPAHPDMRMVQVLSKEAFSIDPRLFL